MSRKTDYIEVGQGVESKVIGGNNSISEYMTVILSMIAFVGQGVVIAWLVAFLALWYWGFLWGWAMLISIVIVLVLGSVALGIILKILYIIKKIQEPMPQRDEKGRFYSTRVASGGKTLGRFITNFDTGESDFEYEGDE